MANIPCVATIARNASGKSSGFLSYIRYNDLFSHYNGLILALTIFSKHQIGAYCWYCCTKHRQRANK